jgi:hypothetical protein
MPAKRGVTELSCSASTLIGTILRASLGTLRMTIFGGSSRLMQQHISLTTHQSQCGSLVSIYLLKMGHCHRVLEKEVH